ncbi:hypothetical protein BO70DRAFT_397207 [Aspergillus heteromorphus CBS 117.55]|uniref:Uncharacterized protein n=1 Tax=Aspergillus heteromorphus CBS 117.55 TaxID=1448321 RepID=A0A317W380_9EURO|nr:uncharacterized protein BO70DRAFT_397207 [Aspergillus heteromorphus CBS 117.55]PWY79732.1 hypothetical protein BO70DRAFT_397207 [Aspergillus heteromorphus CBS 117.55]
MKVVVDGGRRAGGEEERRGQRRHRSRQRIVCPDGGATPQEADDYPLRSPPLTPMEFASDVGVRHAVVLSNLEIRHLVDFSPATASIAREIRLCVIAIVVGWTTSRVVSALLNRRSSDQQ